MPMNRHLLLGSVVLAAATAFAAAKTGVLETLKTDANAAQEAVFSGLVYGNASCPGSCRAVTGAARAEAAKAGVAFAKTYVASDDFKKRYAAQWAADEPKAPTTPEAQLAEDAEKQKQNDLEQEQQDQELKAKAASEKDPNLKKIYTEAIAARSQMKQAMSDPKYKATMDQFKIQHAEELRTAYAADKAAFDKAHTAWEKRKDPKVLIGQRIDEFLALVATVDFKAKTVQNGAMKRFVDEANESKPSSWKMLYRLGPEGCDALKSAAKKWRAEL